MIQRHTVSAFIVCLLAMALPATAQDPAPTSAVHHVKPSYPTEIIFLKNVSQQNDANEIQVAIRNVVDPTTKIYLSANQNAIVLSGDPADISTARQIITALDRPHKSFRITYTVIESDAGKRIGIQHFGLAVYSGQRTTLKQGSKIPVLTGSYSAGNDHTPAGQQTQFTYLDIGMNFDVTLDEVSGGIRMKTKVEQSSIAQEKAGNLEDPIVRQTVIEGISALTFGKPLVLGSVDVPGSTRHYDIEAVVVPEPAP